MRYVVAVSGGIDSVVLLHQLVAGGVNELIVAHFDHGIRADSADDARFVEALARQYGLECVVYREELGSAASEEVARSRRYAFLRRVAAQRDARIMTAHHQDDVIESIAINLERGTGWRGLAVFSSPDILRPLLNQSKKGLRQYALDHRLEWVEDSTNGEVAYLRNRIRRRIARQLDVEEQQLLIKLWERQVLLRSVITDEVQVLIPSQREYGRYEFTMVSDEVAGELLRAAIKHVHLPTPTRPQLAQALLAIRVARPNAIFQIGDGVQLRFTKRTFIVETTR